MNQEVVYMGGVTVTANDVIGHDLYSKGNVQVYDSQLRPSYNVPSGQLVGNVYSWINRASDGKLMFMFYKTPTDYANFNPSYVRYDDGNLSMPDYPDVLDQLQKKQEEDQLKDKGAIRYYFEKYAPWIIGAVVVAIALPALTRRRN